MSLVFFFHLAILLKPLFETGMMQPSDIRHIRLPGNCTKLHWCYCMISQGWCEVVHEKAQSTHRFTNSRPGMVWLCLVKGTHERGLGYQLSTSATQQTENRVSTTRSSRYPKRGWPMYSSIKQKQSVEIISGNSINIEKCVYLCLWEIIISLFMYFLLHISPRLTPAGAEGNVILVFLRYYPISQNTLKCIV